MTPKLPNVEVKSGGLERLQPGVCLINPYFWVFSSFRHFLSRLPLETLGNVCNNTPSPHTLLKKICLKLLQHKDMVRSKGHPSTLRVISREIKVRYNEVPSKTVPKYEFIEKQTQIRQFTNKRIFFFYGVRNQLDRRILQV